MRAIPASTVACGSCRRCCVGELIMLHPEHGDVADLYQTVEVTNPMTGKRGLAIDQRADRSCVYLDADTGCTIHDMAPAICRAFSCLDWFKSKTRAQRRQIERGAPGARAIFARGRELAEGGV